MRRLLAVLRDQSGISSPELIMISGLAAVLGYLVWTNLRGGVTGAGTTIGGKVNNAVATNNPTW